MSPVFSTSLLLQHIDLKKIFLKDFSPSSSQKVFSVDGWNDSFASIIRVYYLSMGRKIERYRHWEEIKKLEMEKKKNHG